MARPEGFAYTRRKNGDVVISHRGRVATVLRGRTVESFLAKLVDGNEQELMARATGNYKRGNEKRR